MTPEERRRYAQLRNAGWPARNALAGSRDLTPDVDNRVQDLMAGRTAEWAEAGYDVRAHVDDDDAWGGREEEYGQFTADDGPDTVPNPRAGSHDLPRFRPEYSIAERIETYRGRLYGMTRADATERAHEGARDDARRGLESQYVALTVTVSLADVELGRSGLGMIESNPDPALAWAAAHHLIAQYLAEMLAELTAEAMAEAIAQRPIIAARLAAFATPEGLTL